MSFPNSNGKKVAVVGSRSLTDKQIVFDFLDSKKDKIKCIVSGGAKKGADEFARQWAELRGFPILIFYPEWHKFDGTFDRGAGFRRNYFIADEADLIIAFMQNGGSNGTQNTIEIAEKLKKPVKIIYFNPVETL